MKKLAKKLIPKTIVKKILAYLEYRKLKELTVSDYKRFNKYSFGSNNNLDCFEQFEARITKAYHSIEKGLSYQNVRLGFGKSALDNLIELMSQYKELKYPIESECYQTALSNLYKYVELHESQHYDMTELKKRISHLNGVANNLGGSIELTKTEIEGKLKEDFKVFSASRHSVRDFSSSPVDIITIKQAINLAQNTPSACNRQGWKIRIVTQSEIKSILEKNQNGNRGFGNNIDKYILVTTDSRYFAKPRERNQPYIDGGMYAMNLLYSLHYYGIATIPLSASLTPTQESNIRKVLDISDAENLILFIGIGNYINSFKVPKSERRKPDIRVY